MESSDAIVQRRTSRTVDWMCGFTLAIALGLLLAGVVLSGILRRHWQPRGELAGRINPNTATTASLLRLPGVGLTRASAIVAYRTQVREETGEDIVFTSQADLRLVRGIGPQTASEMAPWLDLPSSEGLPKLPPGLPNLANKP